MVKDIRPLEPLIRSGLEIGFSPVGIPGEINLNNNPLSTPPIDIILEGRNEVLSFLEDLEKQGTAKLFEAKLIIVGDGGAGKTTLRRKLVNPDAQLPQEEESTRGIDIAHYQFETPEGNNFRMNIWDFGGQTIYHATHQFFLTRRSLYVLVCDTRREHTEFDYWLQVVELLSQKSPIIIVQNLVGNRWKALDVKGIKGRFPNITDIHSVNLAVHNQSLNKVRYEIFHEIQKLPQIGQELPYRWIVVRQELEKISKEKPFIRSKEFFEICAKNGVMEREKAKQFSRYLHDLGVFLHFQDDPILRKTIILQNNWATNAVYKILDNEKIKRSGGHFTRSQVEQIWEDTSYEDLSQELLQLMMKFEICYRVLETQQESFISPQLLPVEKPEYEWDNSGNLVMKFSYDFSPKGIINRLIVRMHRYIKDIDNFAWSSGVILKRRDAEAQIIQTYVSRSIEVRLRGNNKRELLTLINEVFDRIHESFNNLEVQKLIPCNCRHCTTRESLIFINIVIYLDA